MTEVEEELGFELEDYTISGELEKFTSQIEDAIQEWQLNSLNRYTSLDRGELSSVTWGRKMYEVDLDGFKFNLEYHYAQLADDKNFSLADESLEDKRVLPITMEDLNCRSNDFMPRGHPIAVWYGLRAFMVLASGEKPVMGYPHFNCGLSDELRVIQYRMRDAYVYRGEEQVPANVHRRCSRRRSYDKFRRIAA